MSRVIPNEATLRRRKLASTFDAETIVSNEFSQFLRQLQRGCDIKLPVDFDKNRSPVFQSDTENHRNIPGML